MNPMPAACFRRPGLSFLTLTFALCLSTAFSAEVIWKEYVNARFGFKVSRPASLESSREPQNGDGLEFHTADKEFSLMATGHFLMRDDGDSLEKRWEDRLKAHEGTLTYKKKADTWYVISGVSKGGTEYYEKFCTKAGNWAALRMTHPHAKNKLYDPWVEKIVKSFVPFLAGDYDRIEP